MAYSYSQVIKDMHKGGNMNIKAPFANTCSFYINTAFRQGFALSLFVIAIVIDRFAKMIHEYAPW